MATDASVDLRATRELAMRVAQTLLTKGQKAEAIEILTAWASAANDQEGHKLLAEALRHGPDNPLAKAAFARMEGLKTDTSALDQARVKWSFDALTKLEKDTKKPAIGGWQAEVGYNNNVKYRGQVFHIQTEDSGIKRPHIITHLFADGGRILKSYKRSYAELVGRDDMIGQVRLWMKNQHKEMYIALREGRYDNIIDGKEPGGMEMLEGAPNPDARRPRPSHENLDQHAVAAGTAGGAVAEVKPEARAESKPPPRPEARPEPKVETKPPPRPEVKAEAKPGTDVKGPPRPVIATRPSSPNLAPVASPQAPAPAPAKPKAEAPVRARLHVIRAVGDGPLIHEVRDAETFLGRAGGVAIAGDRFAAPRHSRLVVRDNRIELEPLQDLPVFLRLKRPTEIELGDVFVAGEQLLRVEPNPPPNDGPDQDPKNPQRVTYFYSSPKARGTFRVVQLWEGNAAGMCVVARTNSLQVGRSNSDLCFPNDFWLSDAHCVIEDQVGEQPDNHGSFLMLTDLGSRGGTFVRLKQPTALTTGDEILVGRTRLRVEIVPLPKSLAMQPLSETWEALRSLDTNAIPAALRSRLAELWARDALLEHASVASFSKFSLHLMAVAAPPDLLDAAHRAALDEIQHARLCFALASAYAGEPLGPGPLPLEGDLLGALDLASITAAAVREGCVGETISSLEAAEAAEIAQAPAPREALTKIADDEARHAELAWRFVRWALDQNDPTTQKAVLQAFLESLAAPPPPVPPEDPLDGELAHHGRLSEARRSLLWRQGMTEVVRPAAEALLGRSL